VDNRRRFAIEKERRQVMEKFPESPRSDSKYVSCFAWEALS
jgi:hypothetical protein